MDKKVCLDSDIVIDLLKDNSHVVQELESLNAVFYTTTINEFEIWSGRFEKEEKTILDLLNQFQIKNLDSEAAKQAGDIRLGLEKKGENLEFRDIFIASICIVNDLELLTGNKKHFERLKKFGLKLIQFYT